MFRSELTSLKERAREMLLAQGAELSRASLAVSQIYSKLDLHFPGSQVSLSVLFNFSCSSSNPDFKKYKDGL